MRLALFCALFATTCDGYVWPAQEKEKGPELSLEVGTKQDAEQVAKVASTFLELAHSGKAGDAIKLVEEKHRDKVRDFLAEEKFGKLKTINRIAIFEGRRGWLARVKATVEPDQEIGIDLILLDKRWWITVR